MALAWAIEAIIHSCCKPGGDDGGPVQRMLQSLVEPLSVPKGGTPHRSVLGKASIFWFCSVLDSLDLDLRTSPLEHDRVDQAHDAF